MLCSSEDTMSPDASLELSHLLIYVLAIAFYNGIRLRQQLGISCDGGVAYLAVSKSPTKSHIQNLARCNVIFNSRQENKDDRVSPEEPESSQSLRALLAQVGAVGQLHFTDEAILVYRAAFLAPCYPRRLRPHLLNIFENHVAVSIKSFHTSEQFAIIAA